jgi:hypothetical protein
MSAPNILNVAPNDLVVAPALSTSPPMTGNIVPTLGTSPNTFQVLFKVPTTFYPEIGATYMVQMSLGYVVSWAGNAADGDTNGLGLMYGPYTQSATHLTIMTNVLASSLNTTYTGTSPLYEFVLTALFSPTSTNNSTDGNQLRLVIMNNSAGGTISNGNTYYAVYNMSITQLSSTKGTTLTSANYKL